MDSNRCPTCGSSDVMLRTVNDRFRAADPRGETFEVALRLPVWSCRACRLCWQGQEAAAAKEAAYQNALARQKLRVLEQHVLQPQLAQSLGTRSTPARGSSSWSSNKGTAS